MNIEQAKSFVDNVRWQYAKTYPTAPHEYTLLDWQNDKQKYFDFVQMIFDSNDFEYFYRKKFQILIIDEYKYWVMDNTVKSTTLINRTLFDDNEKKKIQDYVCSNSFVHKKGMTMQDIIEEMKNV